MLCTLPRADVRDDGFLLPDAPCARERLLVDLRAEPPERPREDADREAPEREVERADVERPELERDDVERDPERLVAPPRKALRDFAAVLRDRVPADRLPLDLRAVVRPEDRFPALAFERP